MVVQCAALWVVSMPGVYISIESEAFKIGYLGGTGFLGPLSSGPTNYSTSRISIFMDGQIQNTHISFIVGICCCCYYYYYYYDFK